MVDPQIDLISLGESRIHWPFGQIWNCRPTPACVGQAIQAALKHSTVEAFLFWDVLLGDIPVDKILSLLSLPDDLWHAGLNLGMRGQPRLINFIEPTWMLNCDPGQTAATSWRVSLRACLVRAEVLKQVGFIDTEFQSLEAAALEWGHRCLWRGVLCRHDPDLANPFSQRVGSLSAADEVRFTMLRFGKRWTLWAIMRAVLSGAWNLSQPIPAWHQGTSNLSMYEPAPYRQQKSRTADLKNASVSVLIPTIDRYPYLTALLEQLRLQTVPAKEIIIVDQTPATQRQPQLYTNFTDLPLRFIYQDIAGQCSSRNAGLQAVTGDYVLFLDDDEELRQDFIEKHLKNLHCFDAGVSSGVVVEINAGPIPQAFTFLRNSDVFPAGNSMVRRSALLNTGLFDLAYNHGSRADADLGMRLYLSGARMIFDPDIPIFHHHAPRGGLRVHKARIITYASSRKHLTHRSLPSATELYLARRYFTKQQFWEVFWLSILSTFSLHDDSKVRRLLKAVISFVLLPITLYQLMRNRREAEQLAAVHPTIPQLR